MDANNDHGIENQPQVGQQRPVVDVGEMLLDTRFHTVPSEVATVLGTLRKPGNSWFDGRSLSVPVDQLLELFAIFQMVWTWPDNAHRSHQHVHELRNLVKLCVPQKPPDGKDSRDWIVCDFRRSFVGHIHRSKLQNRKRFAKPASSFLAEKERSGRLEPLTKSHRDCKRRQQQHNNRQRKANVNQSFADNPGTSFGS